MLQYTDYLTFIEKAAGQIVSGELLAPLSKFSEQKRYPLKMRMITPIQEQFDERLKTILLEVEPEEAFYQLCELYCQVLPEQRAGIQKCWDFNRTWELPDQTTLACTITKKHSSEERIRASLIYASLMNWHDYRDTLLWLAPIYHSALQSAIQADILFRDIANISSPVAASAIHSFIHRASNDKSLAAWGLEEELIAQGVKIRPAILLSKQ
jgi:hypothetical protein